MKGPIEIKPVLAQLRVLSIGKGKREALVSTTSGFPSLHITSAGVQILKMRLEAKAIARMRIPSIWTAIIPWKDFLRNPYPSPSSTMSCPHSLTCTTNAPASLMTQAPVPAPRRSSKWTRMAKRRKRRGEEAGERPRQTKRSQQGQAGNLGPSSPLSPVTNSHNHHCTSPHMPRMMRP